MKQNAASLSSEHEALLAAARAARAHAYAPYSNFAVGAALESADGTVFTGTNVENASYGLTICAERSAVFGAIAAGHRTFERIAIAGPEGALTSPCGACRQVLAEFSPAMTVIYTTAHGTHVTTVAELLPHSFGPFV
jgi:cytidine deaminase